MTGMSGKVTAVEFGDFDLFEKMENADLAMAANVKSKTHLKKSNVRFFELFMTDSDKLPSW
jgi:hypothetical protein